MFAIISDLHLKENDKDFFKQRREELLIQRIKEINENDNITDVIFNGDTFNEDKIISSGYAINFFKDEVLVPLIQHNKKIRIVVGNHERTYDNKRKIDTNIFTFLKGDISNLNIFVYDRITTTSLGDFNAIFVPFLYPLDSNVSTITRLEEEVLKEVKNMVKELKEKEPNKKVIMFNHNMMTKGLPFDNGREVNIDFMSLKNIDFVFGGHIHKHEVFEKGMYVGSFMKSFVYEEESEGYVIGNVSEKVEYKLIENNSFFYEKLIIEDTNSFNFENIKKGYVYDLEIYFDIGTQDSFFVSDLDKKIAENGSFVKTKKVLTKGLDDNMLGITNTITSDEDILKDYLKENKIEKKEYKSYLEKLEICKSLNNNNSKVSFDNEVEKKEKENIKKVNNLSNIIRTDRKL